MDSFDITDSVFSLANSTSNDIIEATNEIISNPINLIQDVSHSIPVPDFIPVSDVVTESIKEVIPESIDIDDDNSIFIYIGIGFLIILIGVFIYNYNNKNKHVTFNETPEVCYTDSSTSYSTRSEF